MHDPQRPPDSSQRLARRGLIVLGIAVVIIVLTLVYAHGYIEGSFPFFQRRP
jgi:uncharacterized membrane protein